MAYNEYLQERIESVLNDRNIPFRSIKMMGGLCYMIDEKMCLGIVKDELMARVGAEAAKDLLKKKGARQMDMTKRPMNGYLFVEPEAIDYESDLEFWIDQCLAFNPQATSSKKK